MTNGVIFSCKYLVKTKQRRSKSLLKIIHHMNCNLSNFSICIHVDIMYKKILYILLFFSSILLYGCNEQWWFKYEFDNFYGTFNTETEFKVNETELNWLWYNLIQNNIINIYEQKNSEWFKESIIISKKSSDKDLETFSEENIANVDISWLKLSKWKNIEINCSGTSLNLIYYQWKYNMNQYTIYITNWFLKINQQIYSISYATLDEKKRNEFSSNLKTIKCK